MKPGRPERVLAFLSLAASDGEFLILFLSLIERGYSLRI